MDLQTLLVFFIPAVFLTLFGEAAFALIFLMFVFFSGATFDNLLFLLLPLLVFVAAHKMLGLFGARGK